MLDLAEVAGAEPARFEGVRARPARTAGTKRYAWVSWLALIGLIVPGWEGQIQIAGAKFTAGRFAITLLVVPALVMLARRGRWTKTDFAALATAAWMLCAAAVTGGVSSLSSPAAESLQLLFGYLVGRAFYAAPGAADAFVRILLGFTLTLVAIGVAERLTGRWLAHEAAASLFGGAPLTPVFRGSAIRASSTLDHPILFGVFCSLVNALALLWERKGVRRAAWSALCLAGCFLSQSSAAFMAFALGWSVFVYDRGLRSVPARWSLFWTSVSVAALVVFVAAEHPIGWVISHLTLDPETGYFRILIWDAAFERIGQNPLFGHSFALLNDNILDATVDCVWLVEALRYGVPAIILLFLTNISAVWPVRNRAGRSEADVRMNFAFGLVLFLFMFSGVTVHYWNYIWIFWGLCLGIKTTLRARLYDARI